MSEGISCVENDLSKIDINKSSFRRRKLYPKSLIPDLQPPSQPTPSRIISSTTKSMSTIKLPSDKRIISYPMSEKSTSKQQYQFSFMKDTSSSLKKKNNPFIMNTPSSTSPSIPSTIPKKRLEPQRTRRYVSSTLPYSSPAHNLKHYHPPKLAPIDITNLNLSPNKILNQNIEYSPTRDNRSIIKRNASQPIPDSNVFNRLYPKPPPPPSPSNPSELSHRKISTIPDLYQILHERDPSLFTFASENDNNSVGTKPFTADEILLNKLNVYERGEIIRKADIYYAPTSINRNINITNYNTNFGFDDKCGNYIVIPHDHINYRYEIKNMLGNGSFGNVIKSIDHKSNKIVAVKIIKNDLNWSLQSINEIKVLKFLNKENSNDNILKYYDHFNFRSHMCIVTELLSINLYSLLEVINFRGLSLPIIQTFTSQLLNGLQFLHQLDIIHCDIKPENIMIKLPSNPQSNSIGIKIIDFGSSCYKNEISFTYIQSRFYRAPEVILGANYTEKIDIWSLGCVIVELFLGIPLLPGKNEIEQIGFILEYFGAPKSSTILRLRKVLNKSTNQSIPHNNLQIPSLINEKQIKKTLLFKIFDINGKINMSLLNFHLNNPGPNNSTSTNKKQFKLNSKNLEINLNLNKYSSSDHNNQLLNKLFIKFLNNIFIWDPTERSNVNELLNDPFLQ
ncbi:serine-threonine protein kinase [Scheffersomyces coipomensis]|uniref:serine-threonine protein kinase n=1 Tax=Scheffersomyces coipomensis TaxID=1788519 RepID=UPI00315D2B6F